MPGGKGKSTGGKAGPKAAEGKTQKSHSAKAGLQVSLSLVFDAPFATITLLEGYTLATA